MSRPRIPVTVVTGFLGAGKTTLLSNLIGQDRHRRLAILVNEFGEISIDGALLRDHGDTVDIHDLAHGLVAYDDDTDFLPAMDALWQRRARIDHVLIETSGLALPSAAMAQLQGPALADRFVLDATLAVIDTPLLLAGEFELGAPAELFGRQLEHADIVVLNKIDALAESALIEAEARIRARAPSVRFIEPAWQARLDTRLTLGLHLHEASAERRFAGPVSTLPAAGFRPPANQAVFDGHRHGGGIAHSHGLDTHKHFHEQDPGWQSFVLKSGAAQDGERLRAALATLAREEPLLRVKGFATPQAGGGRLLLQAVRSRVELIHAPDAPPPRAAQLVFIGYHPSRPRIAARLGELTGERWK
jgi:cobalamin biosynthesis protein CobW